MGLIGFEFEQVIDCFLYPVLLKAGGVLETKFVLWCCIAGVYFRLSCRIAIMFYLKAR